MDAELTASNVNEARPEQVGGLPMASRVSVGPCEDRLSRRLCVAGLGGILHH